jgi:hypothetical protein
MEDVCISALMEGENSGERALADITSIWLTFAALGRGNKERKLRKGFHSHSDAISGSGNYDKSSFVRSSATVILWCAATGFKMPPSRVPVLSGR